MSVGLLGIMSFHTHGRSENMSDGRKLKWGIISTAKIGVEKVIPAMMKGEATEVVAIASRDQAKAEATARDLGIPRAYGSYEALLADPEIEAVYNPLPNHLHVPVSIQAAEAGKHVLCEKPVALSAKEAEELVAARDRTGVKIQEAFMVRTHPQWLAARDRVQSGELGDLVAAQYVFGYFNRDPENIRNKADIGGGGIMDIGCYPIRTSRFVLGEEPTRVMALVDFDPELKVDRLASAILDYPSAQVSFICSTQCVPYQRAHFLGTTGRLEIEIPFNAPPDRPCRAFVSKGDIFGEDVETFTYDTCDQYTIQGDDFSRAVLEDREVTAPLEDAVNNMRVIDAVFRSAKSGEWETP
jgi:predicted dehydrogenase